jgi:RNA recognition motif-containing protein
MMGHYFMNAKLYVENIAPATTENELKDLFSTYGNVAEVNIILDRTHQKPRGLGFVTMVTPEGAWAAIQALHGKQIGEQHAHRQRDGRTQTAHRLAQAVS